MTPYPNTYFSTIAYTPCTDGMGCFSTFGAFWTQFVGLASLIACEKVEWKEGIEMGIVFNERREVG